MSPPLLRLPLLFVLLSIARADILLRIPPFLGPSPVIGGHSFERELLLLADKSAPLFRFEVLSPLTPIVLMRLDRAEILMLRRIPPFLVPAHVIGGPSLDLELLPRFPLVDVSLPLLRLETL